MRSRPPCAPISPTPTTSPKGAGATPLAAALKDKERRAGKVGLILSGGNVDLDVYARVLSET